jgi:hypothetical protein
LAQKKEAVNSFGTLVTMYHTALDQNIKYLDLVSHSQQHPSSHIINPLTPELNPSAQRCLTRFLLGIMFLEPRISLIYIHNKLNE